VPELRLGGWVYHLTRLNLGIASGGVWVWDDSASSCFEVPYFLNHSLQLLPKGRRDLNEFTWPDGVSLKTLEPMTRYRLRFADRDVIALDLEYRGLTAPYVSASGTPPRPFRLEQPCRVVGRLVLRGREIAVDSIGMRDHSWGLRPERTVSAQPGAALDMAQLAKRPVVYFYGHASGEDGFFIMGNGGYLLRDGLRVDLAEQSQEIERDAEDGHIRRITVRGRDRNGRSLEAIGTPLSWIVRPSNSGVGYIYVVEWRIDGQAGIGDLQDVWPIDEWSAFRAQQRKGRRA
jgi:hypothetical protein